MIGDRDGGLNALQNGIWDAVLDINCYLPRLARDSATLLKGNIGHYLFISAGNVYDFSIHQTSFDEKAQVVLPNNLATEEYWGPEYGGLKLRNR